jgi:hypothetical protein
MKSIENCDMCGSEIIDSKCCCGVWIKKEDAPSEVHAFQEAIKAFHRMGKLMFSGEAPHLGVSFVFFRGDYNDCLEVKEHIKSLKSRPHYEE